MCFLIDEHSDDLSKGIKHKTSLVFIICLRIRCAVLLPAYSMSFVCFFGVGLFVKFEKDIFPELYYLI